MKQLLFIIFILSASSAMSQKKTFFTVSSGLDFPKRTVPLYSGHISFNYEVIKELAIGITGGIVVFTEAKEIYLPVAANITILLGNRAKVAPIIILQPGYGIYNSSDEFPGFNIETKGGFSCYAGAGLVIPTGASSIFLTGGLNHYTFKTYGEISRSNIVAIRLGIMIH